MRTISVAFAVLSVSVSVLGQVVINEVGWAGTVASVYDEWIELYNASEEMVRLDGWTLFLGERGIPLVGEIPPKGFFLLERTDDSTIPGVEADLVYKGPMANAGVVLKLVDAEGRTVDTANLGCPKGWFAGDVEDKSSMERVSPGIPDSPVAWRDGIPGNARDAGGNPILGTSRAANAAWETALGVKVSYPDGPWSGTVVISWEVGGVATGIEVRIYAFVEGVWTPLAHGLPGEGSFPLDTTALPNGTVLLAVGAFDGKGSRGGTVVGVEIRN